MENPISKTASILAKIRKAIILRNQTTNFKRSATFYLKIFCPHTLVWRFMLKTLYRIRAQNMYF